jgi:hypothetical protein
MTLGRRGRFALVSAALVLAGCDALAASPTAPTQPAVVANAEQLFGPWSATPLAIDATLLASIDDACRTSNHLGQDFPAGVELVVIDARGLGIVQAYYSGSGNEAFCSDIRIHADGTVEATGDGQWATDVNAKPVAGGIRINTAGSSGIPGNSTAYAWGAYGPNVRRIVVEEQARPPMIAAMQGGWWAVSTRGDWARDAHLTGYDGFGHEVVQIPLQ